MKTKIIIILAVLILIAGAAAFIQGRPELSIGNNSERRTYDSDKFELRFKYPKKYFLETKELGDGHRGHFAIVLTEDTEENRLVREGKAPGREGPVAISIDLYQSPEELRPLSWVMGHSGSNFKLSDGAYELTTLAGREAVSYSWDGLYRADNVVVTHNDYIASMVVTYITPEDEIRKDFGEILKTVEFY